MNREIKFRGVEVETNEWIYGGYGQMPLHECPLNCSEETHHACIGPHECIGDYIPAIINTEWFEGREDEEHIVGSPIYPQSLGQLTGLFDKNDNEIYEGDILENIERNIKGVVKWSIDGAGFWVDYSASGATTFKGLEESVIIGNIYEHQELLTP